MMSTSSCCKEQIQDQTTMSRGDHPAIDVTCMHIYIHMSVYTYVRVRIYSYTYILYTHISIL